MIFLVLRIGSSGSVQGGIKSPLAFWLGGAGSRPTTEQAGLQSLLGIWRGGSTSSTQAGFTSLLGFWLGGITAGPTLEEVILVGGKLRHQRKPTKTHLRVGSSDINQVVYDPNSQQMKVKFMTGSEYSFSNVDQKYYDGIARARSAGKYFHNQVKGKHNFLRTK